jgi:hypothetical protein
MCISTMADKNDVIAIVRILRRVTAIVKVYPFLYSMLYVSCMFVYMFCSDEISILCDQLFYTSPFMIVCAIGLSYSLKLCKWHRLECALPMFPLIPLVIDYYIYPISRFGAIVNGISILTLIILSLVNAYFVFRRPRTTNAK